MPSVPDFTRSFLRFYIDFERHTAITLSHRPPTVTNRVRIGLESICHITDRRDNRTRRFVLGSSCKTERVGGPGDLWLQPNADFCLTTDGEEFLIQKSWHKINPGVMRVPESLGPQPERQTGLVKEAWNELSIEIEEVNAVVLDSFEAIGDAIASSDPMVSRTEFEQGDYRVRIDHPVKTINIAERDRVYQTDTGPIVLPDLSAERLAREERFAGVFNLAYSAFNCPDWAEFIVQAPISVADGVSINHYSQPRRIEPAQNTLFWVKS